MDEFIKDSNPKLRVSLERLNSGTIEFYQLEPLPILEENDSQLFIKDDVTAVREPASTLLAVQQVEYDADSEAETSHTLTPRPSLHRRRSTFKKEKSRVR